jgi:hypothetical protein
MWWWLLGLFAVRAAEPQCAAGAEGACAADPPSARFLADAKAKGMDMRIKRKGEKMLTTEDIFYGRYIFRIPRSAALSNETLELASLRLELAAFLERLRTDFNVTNVEDIHMVSTVMALLAERRLGDSSRFKPWLDRVANTSVLVFELTPRQRQALAATSVNGSYEEMQNKIDFVHDSIGNTSLAPTTREEVKWAISVILRHARTVHPPFDAPWKPARMMLLPVDEVLDMDLSVKNELTVALQEDSMKYGEHKQHEGYFITQIARSDLVKGTPIYFWPGRFSNSELILRFGRSFNDTQVGIGRNVSLPSNWSPKKEAPIHKEYAKYNCSSQESFEIRFSARGKPSKQFVRCFRVAWFMSNGWYSPMVLSRVHLLDKWPPPKKYDHDDWLSWTQADLELNKVLNDYCSIMKARIDELDFELMEELAASNEPNDKLVHELVVGERQAFGNCLKVNYKFLGKSR